MESRINLVFFSKENTGGTVGFFDKIFPDLQHFFDVHIFFYKRIDEGFFIESSTFLSQISTAGMSLSLRKFMQVLKNLFITTRTIRLLREDSIIIVLDLYTYIIVCFSRVLARKNFQTVYVVENNVEEVLRDNRSLIYRLILSFTYQLFISHISQFVFTCKRLSYDFVKKFPVEKRRVNIIPLGVDVKKIASKNEKIPLRESNLFKGTTGIITVMNFTPQKDLETVIKAFAHLNKKFPKLRLFVVGSGYDKSNFETKIEKLKIKNKVFFLGWKKNVISYLKKCKVFVFSSRYEGFGVAILEAMSTGLPVVSSNTKYGPADILQNQKYGLLYPVGDVGKLRLKIEVLLTNSKLRRKYKNLSIERSASYDTSIIGGKYRQFFSKISNYEKSVNNNKAN